MVQKNYVAKNHIEVYIPIISTYSPGNYSKKAKNRKTGFAKNRQVLKMFHLTTKFHLGIY